MLTLTKEALWSDFDLGRLTASSDFSEQASGDPHKKVERRAVVKVSRCEAIVMINPNEVY